MPEKIHRRTPPSFTVMLGVALAVAISGSTGAWAIPVCGNGICETSGLPPESQVTCPADCGSPPPPPETGYLNYTLSQIPVCTAYVKSYLDLVETDLQGMHPLDLRGHYIGSSFADGWFSRNWYPLDVYKRSMCATVDRYQFYDPWGDEADWNVFVKPTAAFSQMLDDPIADGASDIHNCQTMGGKCMEAEVTPDQGYYHNSWFPKSQDVTPLQGRDICFYGPWVGDGGHGRRPEIHPAEIVWWHEIYGGDDSWRVIFLQDDSNRYDSAGSFDPDIQSPARAWSAAPREERVKLTFRVPLSAQSSYDYWVHNLDRDNIYNAPADFTSGTLNHILRVDGQPVLRVYERPTGNSLAVTLDRLCRDTSSGELRGYIQLRTKFGFGSSGDEGFHELHVVLDDHGQSLLGSGPAASAEKTVAGSEGPRGGARFAGLEETLRAVEHATGRRLLGDVLIEISAAQGLEVPDLSQATLKRQGEDATLAFEPVSTDSGAPTSLLRLRDVPVMDDLRFELVLADGSSILTGKRPVSVLTFPEAVPVVGGADPEAWASLSEWLGGLAVAPPAELHRIDAYRVQSEGIYAPHKNGKPSGEELSLVAEQLNKAMRQKGDSFRRLFGDSKSQPITVRWQASFTEIGSGDRVGDGVDGAGSQADIATPDAADLTRMDFHAKASDVFGTEGSGSLTLWSHALVDEPKALALRARSLAAELAGAPADVLASLANRGFERPLPPDQVDMSESATRARMFRLRAEQTAADGLIDPGELRGLVELARRFEH